MLQTRVSCKCELDPPWPAKVILGRVKVGFPPCMPTHTEPGNLYRMSTCILGVGPCILSISHENGPRTIMFILELCSLFNLHLHLFHEIHQHHRPWSGVEPNSSPLRWHVLYVGNLGLRSGLSS